MQFGLSLADVALKSLFKHLFKILANEIACKNCRKNCKCAVYLRGRLHRNCSEIQVSGFHQSCVIFSTDFQADVALKRSFKHSFKILANEIACKNCRKNCKCAVYLRGRLHRNCSEIPVSRFYRSCVIFSTDFWKSHVPLHSGNGVLCVDFRCRV